MNLRFLDLIQGCIWLFACVLILFLLIVSYPNPINVNATVDLSWPNCQDLPNLTFSNAVIGINGGLDFHSNPCAANEAAQVLKYSLYVNSGNPGYPKIREIGKYPLICGRYSGIFALKCYSFNYGYEAAQYSIHQASLDGLHARFWWIDVETINSWTVNKNANRADIEGMIYALHGLLFTVGVGIYTAPNLWHELVGNWQLGLPLWLGTGSQKLNGVANYCRTKSVTGGPVYMAQYSINNIDFDVVCRLPLSINKVFNFNSSKK